MVLTTHEILVLLGGIFGGGVAATLVAQLLKKLFRLKVSSAIHIMATAVAGIAAGAQYIISIKSKIPPEILGISGPAIYGWSQLVYKNSKYTKGFLLTVAAKAVAPAPAGVGVSEPAPTAASPVAPVTNDF